MDCDGIQHFCGHKTASALVRARPREEISRADKPAIQAGISDDE